MTFKFLQPVIFQVLCHMLSNKGWTFLLNPQLCITLPFYWTWNSKFKHLIFILDTPCRAHVLTPVSRLVPCVLYLPPFHSIQYYLTINELWRGVLWHGAENMTYLAAAATLVGASTYNKNSQLSFVLGPRFLCTYTNFGYVKGLEEVMICKG